MAYNNDILDDEFSKNNPVLGFDIDEQRIKELKKSIDKTGEADLKILKNVQNIIQDIFDLIKDKNSTGKIITKIKSLCLIENNKRKSELIYYTYFFNTDTNEEKLLEMRKEELQLEKKNDDKEWRRGQAATEVANEDIIRRYNQLSKKFYDELDILHEMMSRNDLELKVQKKGVK